MAFIDQRLSDVISFGVTGGPGYLTAIASTQTGTEMRNAQQSRMRHRYEISEAIRPKSAMLNLIAFFNVMLGRLNSFRLKDFADFQATGSEGVVSALTSPTWQMQKRYTSGNSHVDRLITKPVSGTVAVSGGGVYTVDYATGIITKVSGADPTGWTGEFDVHVRFDVDEMKHEIVDKSVSELQMFWQSIPIIEVFQ